MRKIVGLSVACSIVTFSFSANGLNIIERFVSNIDRSKSAAGVQEVDSDKTGCLKRRASENKGIFVPVRKKSAAKSGLAAANGEDSFSDEKEAASDLDSDGGFDFADDNPAFLEEGVVESVDDRSVSRSEDVEANMGLVAQLKRLEKENRELAKKLEEAEAGAVNIEEVRMLITKALEVKATDEDFECPDVKDVNSLMKWISYSRESCEKINSSVRAMVCDAISIFYHDRLVSKRFTESQFNKVKKGINHWSMNDVFKEFTLWLTDVHQVQLQQKSLANSANVGPDAAVSVGVKDGKNLNKKTQEASSDGNINNGLR